MTELPGGWVLEPLIKHIASKSGDSKIIKGKQSSQPRVGLVQGFSASGPDVWVPEAQYNGQGIIVSAVGARCGKTFQANGAWTAIANTHVLVPSAECGIDFKWLWYLTNDEDFWIRSGTAQPFVKVKDTLLRPQLIPPLEEQKRIVEALDDHLSRVDKALAELRVGQELLKAAIRSLLHKVMNGSGSSKKLSELCSVITDGSHFSPKTVSQGFPYITVRDIAEDEIDFDGCKYISGESYAELEKNGCRPLPNDVLFSKDGTVGKVTVVSSDKPFVVLSSLAILRPDQEKVLPSFLKLALKSPMVLENALGMKTGTAIRRVVLRNLKNLEIDVPPLEQQVQLVEYVDTQLHAFSIIDKALQSQVVMLGGLRRSLLNAAFSGQLLEGK